MKRAILISTVAALTLTAGAGAALAFGKDRMGGHHNGPREMFSFEEVDTNTDGKITQEEIAAHFKAKFDAADTDKDGSLSAEEMAAQMKAKQADSMAKRAAYMVEKRDANSDGKLSFDEMQPQKQGRMFDRLDGDDDGAISKEEFAKIGNRMAKRGYGEDKNGRMMRHDDDHYGRGMGKGDCQK